jgi:hypothetical protein
MYRSRPVSTRRAERSNPEIAGPDRLLHASRDDPPVEHLDHRRKPRSQSRVKARLNQQFTHAVEQPDDIELFGHQMADVPH